jgi:deoxyribonuclease I
MTMQNLVWMTLFFFSLSTFAQVGQKISDKQWAYYGQDFYQGRIDKESLNRILNSSHSSSKGKFDSIGPCVGTCYKHTSVGYDNARKFLFGEIYVLRDGQGTYVSDVYCAKKFHFKEVEDASGMHTQVNIEHTWPQSKFSSKYERGMQKSDMHHLFLTDSIANSNRGNHEFGDVSNVKNESSAQNCEISRLGRVGGDMLYMPPTPHRGNAARALFYFAIHYGLTISEDQEKVLRKWHKADPVDANELTRHEQISVIQNVRNPFVDHPELVEKISNF